LAKEPSATLAGAGGALNVVHVEQFRVHVAGAALAKIHFAHHMRLQRLHVLVQHRQCDHTGDHCDRGNDHRNERNCANIPVPIFLLDVHFFVFGHFFQ